MKVEQHGLGAVWEARSRSADTVCWESGMRVLHSEQRFIKETIALEQSGHNQESCLANQSSEGVKPSLK